MCRVFVNDYVYFYASLVTIYQALIQKDWYLPRFCYHVKLLIAGNCRMCVVEIKNSLKPVIACSTLIYKDADIQINSVLTFKARESVLQFILNNHPLDCPICDQGGECDLQDQYMIMGSNESRYFELNKKSVKDKNISFLLKLSLNKCINCSRCTRFSQVVNGDYSFSLIGRGENLFISNYFRSIGKIYEISANVMDLCPVGAITSKLISYSFRVWEFNDVSFIDYFDPFNPPIRIDYKGLRILRVLPLMNDFLKEEWISDRMRLNTKVFYSSRNTYNYQVNKNFMNKLSWKNLFLNIKNYFISNLKYYCSKKLFYSSKSNLCKNTIDCYSYLYFKFMFKNFFYFDDKYKSFKNINRSSAFFKNIDFDFMDINTFLIFNLNLRNQYPILNFKIREKSVLDFSKVIVVGFMLNLNYYYEYDCNVKSFFLNNFGVFHQNTVLFYSENNFLNFGLDLYKLNLNKSNLKDLSIFNNFNIMKFEFNKSSKFGQSFFTDYFSSDFFFNDFKMTNNLFLSKNKVLLSFNIIKKPKFDFIVPLKQVFERSSIFLNIFGVINDFTFSSYRYFFKELKSDWFLFKSFFKKCGVKFKFKLSNFKNYIISRKWKYSHFVLSLFSYKKFVNDYHILHFFNFDCMPVFFRDVFSKNNKIISFLYKFEHMVNKLANYVFYNKIFWLF